MCNLWSPWGRSCSDLFRSLAVACCQEPREKCWPQAKEEATRLGARKACLYQTRDRIRGHQLDDIKNFCLTFLCPSSSTHLCGFAVPQVVFWRDDYGLACVPGPIREVLRDLAPRKPKRSASAASWKPMRSVSGDSSRIWKDRFQWTQARCVGSCASPRRVGWCCQMMRHVAVAIWQQL